MVYKVTRMIMMFTALVQLALSQIHIEMITKLFVRDVGFYLFIFIISGLLILFNLTSMKDAASGRLGMYIVVTLMSLLSCSIFTLKVWGDYLVQDSVLLEDIRLSLIFIIASAVIYLVGGVIVLIKSLKKEGTGSYA